MHELRVETRRLLAWLDLCAPLLPASTVRSAYRRGRRLLKLFAPLRDTQVQLQLVERQLQTFPVLADFRRKLARHERRLLARAEHKLRRFKVATLMDRLDAVGRGLRRAFANPAAARASVTAVQREAQAAFAETIARRQAVEADDPATVHRLRVAFKRLRYTLELLTPVLPRINAAMPRRMRAYQTRMGELQDHEVLRRNLEEFAARQPARARKLDRFRSAVARQQTRRLQRFLARADPLPDFRPPRLPKPQ